MNKSKPSRKGKLVSFAISLLATFLLAYGFFVSPYGQNLLAARSLTLTQEGDKLSDSEPYQAIASYKTAFRVSPRNTQALTKMANLYLKLDQPEKALETLKAFPPDQITPNTLLIESRALLETGNLKPALDLALRAADQNPNQDTWLQLGLCYILNGNRPELSSLMNRLAASEAAKTLEQASSSNTGLGQVLYSAGLLRSSERVLESRTANIEDYLLLTKVKLSRGNSRTAGGIADKGLALDPGNLELRILRRQIYQTLGDQPAADREGELIRRLQTGRI